MSAWLTTRLDDYEGHVGLETVGQAAAVRDMLHQLIRRHAPASLLYLGCAGGNGLEAVEGGSVQRTVAVDLNPAFLVAARQRWGHLPGIEFHECDLGSALPRFTPVDLAFGALVFEYLPDLSAVLARLASAVCSGGHLIAPILTTGVNAPAVVDSPFKARLEAVGREFRYLDVDAFLASAAARRFRLTAREESPLPAGKSFVILTLERE